MSKRAKFFRVNRAGSEVGRVNRAGSEVSRVVRGARFARGSASVSSSLSRCRFRDGGFAGAGSSWVGRSPACESSAEVCSLSMVKDERKGNFLSK